MEKNIREILNEDVFEWYPNRYPFKSYINSIMNFVDMNGVIAVAGLFVPKFIEQNGHIFLKENVKNRLEKNKLFPCPLGKDKRTTERYYNLFNLEEFFILTADESSSDIRMVKKLGELLVYFWSRRLKELFPEKQFLFEIKKNLYNEHGFCLTFWQE
ncbi:hypothetical protein KKA53_01685 [Candidatus Dependentiae bacterium]|nr:hypothetical protein [Candidatus Dependentiae bacterium]